MRGGRDLSRSLPVAEAPSGPRSDWRTLGRLLPYLWQYKWRVAAALLFVIGAKVANVSVPLLLKELIDRMTLKPGDPAALLVVPVGLLLAYGALRLMTSAYTELRELLFAMATAAFQTRSASFAPPKDGTPPMHLGKCLAWDFNGPVVERLYPMFFRWQPPPRT